MNVGFHVLLGEPDKVLPDFVKSKEIGGVVTDFTPLRKPLKWLEDVANKLPKNVPLCQVCVLKCMYLFIFQFSKLSNIVVVTLQKCKGVLPVGNRDWLLNSSS